VEVKLKKLNLTTIIFTALATLFLIPNVVQAEDPWEQESGTQNIYYNTGNIGIGTTNPDSLLHVLGGDVVFEGAYDETIAPDLTVTGSRFIFHPETASLRAGYVDSDHASSFDKMWHGSVGLGLNVTPAGEGAFAIGYAKSSLDRIQAAKKGALAFGCAETRLLQPDIVAEGTTAIDSYGVGSVAMGYASRIATSNGNGGAAIVAFGDGCIALGKAFTDEENDAIIMAGFPSSNGAFAGGYVMSQESNTANGNAAFTWGRNVQNTGDYAFIYGQNISNTDKNTFKVGWDNVVFSVTENGVGIGTSNPQSKLAVSGTITAKEVKVTETGWSDYVFEEGYDLRSLDQVESFIKQNKHLPEIPSGQEIKDDGLSMADMIAMQMAKIEELTLYLIKLNKENESLKMRVASLEANSNK
jgi:hypothetical protein